ncbi:hypothetical protein U2F26_09855 [Micromonospora sp. 4G57]|uniref:Uncharacterized protein n=1 Tax=Micromonospora sicca TaxID=2202420 RepID=A0ABU5J6U0_9ACTN|nr:MULTISPECIES: hypothetical protein [unclassified Micromonospora]MDZ5443031.1 hypothetical protein [Micromonospora sp. 4G57]MDZ5488257.1 hypothetical protein [Micromonospora sp. 4G53]
MPPPGPRSDVDQRRAPAMLVVVAVLTAARHACRPVGLCIVIRLVKAVPGCVPAWSADRAPPGRPAVA